MGDQFDAASGSARPEPKRDQWGRYMIPETERGGKPVAWTRATTWASTVADTFGLTKWQMRMVAKGLVVRRDLFALAAATPVEDSKTLDRVVHDAKEAAAASAGANLGSALHAFTEQVDLGNSPTVPDPWAADVKAYSATLAREGLRMNPDWVERIVVVRSLKVAGTLDRIATLPDGRQVIADVKTGKDLAYSWGEIAIQLALYAHGDAMWDTAIGRYLPMPTVDQDIAVVMWLPVGQARCELFTVDIAAGWEMAQTCGVVREWRKRKDLSTAGLPAAAVATPDPLAGLKRQSATNEIKTAISAAQTVADLTAIWAAADAAGQWNTTLTAAAAARKNVLASTGRAHQ